jgi:hypothetical protein
MMHAVKYLGEKGEDRGDVPISVQSPFVVECPECRNPYNFRMEDLEQVESDQAPPSDFEDKV